MRTCNDCIHYEAHKHFYKPKDWEKDFDDEMNREGVEGLCPVFEAKQEADVATVVHGHWLENYAANGTHYCSECGHDALYSCVMYNSEFTMKEVLSIFCPHCGAKMDMEEE